MNSISADIISKNIQTTNQVLTNAQIKSIELAQKLLQVNTEIKVGVESGKGKLLDILA